MTKKEAKGGRRGIESLTSLLPYMGRHWIALAVGFAFMLVQNYGAVRVPAYFQKILDELTGANRDAVIGSLILTACLYAGDDRDCHVPHEKAHHRRLTPGRVPAAGKDLRTASAAGPYFFPVA